MILKYQNNKNRNDPKNKLVFACRKHQEIIDATSWKNLLKCTLFSALTLQFYLLSVLEPFFSLALQFSIFLRNTSLSNSLASHGFPNKRNIFEMLQILQTAPFVQSYS
ncbi:hypothetical protein CDL12_29995 [Handroanthus impetiginosus]|uniref:Uncharacterized protein n=1 Tax=Handroanthus impetiginosus TaxID=429701 RepID=A0A2G9FWU4_9LAMI|nr:hypothetical protein CDL12_30129 [Handroanthus impetiginosus]PIM97537.1 hypothetical protein CDL12_29995 [Handroanthus impetiginosus]